MNRMKHTPLNDLFFDNFIYSYLLTKCMIYVPDNLLLEIKTFLKSRDYYYINMPNFDYQNKCIKLMFKELKNEKDLFHYKNNIL